MLAMGLFPFGVATSPKILNMGYWLKVIGIDAGRIRAEVVDLQIIRDRADKFFISKAVSLHNYL